MLKLNLPRVTVAELGELSQQVISKVQTSKATEILETVFFKNLISIAESYQLSLGKKKKTEYTVKVAEKDEKRDNAIIGLRLAVTMHLRRDEPKEVAIAEKAQKIMKSFAAGIDKLPYNEESQKIKTLLAELKKPENEDVANSNVYSGLIKDLEAAQDEFDKLVSEKQEDKIAINELSSATIKRKDLENALIVLFDYIVSGANFKSSEELKALVKSLQEVLDDFSVSRRNKKSDSDDEKENKKE